MYETESVLENKMHKILFWDADESSNLDQKTRPHVNQQKKKKKKKRKEKKRKRICRFLAKYRGKIKKVKR